MGHPLTAIQSLKKSPPSSNEVELEVVEYPESQDLPPKPMFRVGDLVTEKFCHPRDAVVFEVHRIVRPERDGRGRYWNPNSYVLFAKFPEDRGAILSEYEVAVPEPLLCAFEDEAESMISSLLSKAQDLRDLNYKKHRKKETRWNS